MLKWIKYSLLLLVIILCGCSKQSKIDADELFISVHGIGPQMGRPIRYIPPLGKKNSSKLPVLDTSEVRLDAKTILQFKSVNISHSAYYPRFIIKVTRDGRILGYVKDFERIKDGYFDLTLSDSLATLFNKLIHILQTNRLDTLYSELRGRPFFYEGPQYFIYLKYENKIKQSLILHNFKGPNYIVDFAERMYAHFKKGTLAKSISPPFRRDTLIVKKNEEYYDSLFNIK